MKKPDKEGWWKWTWTDKDGTEERDIEVYVGPNDCSLCVWCGDMGVGHYEPLYSEGDEMLGHIIAAAIGGDWTYLRPLD
jgi:hypothetical protein